jgi:hypothetical protein
MQVIVLLFKIAYYLTVFNELDDIQTRHDYLNYYISTRQTFSRLFNKILTPLAVSFLGIKNYILDIFKIE